jgi:hypothetical protein
MLKIQINIVGDIAGGPLGVTFDRAFEALNSLPRLFIEPDGSFVWTGNTPDGLRWQLDGNLIDRGDVLAYIEVKGTCLAPQLDELLTAFGWPRAPLAFQLPQRGIVLEEAAFRALASTDDGAK